MNSESLVRETSRSSTVIEGRVVLGMKKIVYGSTGGTCRREKVRACTRAFDEAGG